MSLPYRPNVCMLVYNPQRQLWIGERYGCDTWQFPQGGVKADTDLKGNVIREVCEELGLQHRHLGAIEQLQATHRYDFLHTPPRWKHRWRGQEQTFWTVEFLGQDQDIRLDRHHPQEFSRWSWCPPEEVLQRVEPIRRAGYVQPLEEFKTRFVNC